MSFVDWLCNDNENRMKERMRILELRIKKLENPDDPYVANIRGRTWHYHHIDSDGNIIEKR